MKFLLYLFFILVTIITFWQITLTPSNNRDWSKDQVLLPYAVFNNNEVTIFNIRNFTYESSSEYTPNYYDKTFNLNELTSVDYITEPFGSIGAAHTFVSFGFSNDEHIAVSVEIRKEVGETFSPLKGVFKQYEIMYVIADEQDVIKLRTNHRKNDVYLYPVATKQENMQQLFIDMLTRANELNNKPEFYNTLTNTCTTNIAKHINNISHGRIPWDIRLLLPKNSDRLAYELGLLDTSIPFNELKEEYLITPKAKLHTDSENFSHFIRQ